MFWKIVLFINVGTMVLVGILSLWNGEALPGANVFQVVASLIALYEIGAKKGE